MNEIIEQFNKHASSASYHYADDSCKEWGSADKELALALKLFDDNPDLQDEMRELAKGQLWSIQQKRPKEE